MATLTPPFTKETAQKKVKAVQNLWNERNPEKSAAAYTLDATWFNRNFMVIGSEDILYFLKRKFTSLELDYRVRKELFAFQDNRLAVQFWFEYRDGTEAVKGNTVWKRTYGLEHWTFAEDGKMKNGHMSGNDIVIQESERWFQDGVDIDSVNVSQ